MKNSFFRRAQLFRSIPMTFGGLILVLGVFSVTENAPQLIHTAWAIFFIGCAMPFLAVRETLSVLHVDQNGLRCTVLGITHWTCRWDEIQVFEFGRGYFAKVIKITFQDNGKNRVTDIEITRRSLKILRNSCPREDIRAAIGKYVEQAI